MSKRELIIIAVTSLIVLLLVGLIVYVTSPEPRAVISAPESVTTKKQYRAVLDKNGYEVYRIVTRDE